MTTTSMSTTFTTQARSVTAGDIIDEGMVVAAGSDWYGVGTFAVSNFTESITLRVLTPAGAVVPSGPWAPGDLIEVLGHDEAELSAHHDSVL